MSILSRLGLASATNANGAVTAETRAWLGAQATHDQAAALEKRAWVAEALVERLRTTPSPEDMWMEVRCSEQGEKARRLGRDYGRASRTIAEQRGTIARLRAERSAALMQVDLIAQALGCRGCGPAYIQQTALRGDRMLAELRAHFARLPAGAALEQNAPADDASSSSRDDETVAKAERYGDEISPGGRPAVAAAADVLALHVPIQLPDDMLGRSACTCGLTMHPGPSWPQHVAERLAHAEVLAPAEEPLAEWEIDSTPVPGPRPTPRTGTFRTGATT